MPSLQRRLRRREAARPPIAYDAYPKTGDPTEITCFYINPDLD